MKTYGVVMAQDSRFPGFGGTVNRVEPVPRRVRGVLNNRCLFDTSAARYVWEWPGYPQFYIPVADVVDGVLRGDGRSEETEQGHCDLYSLHVGDVVRPHAAKVFEAGSVPGPTVRFDWEALDAWFEEDEEVFVHPRSPYTRVDALRSSRRVTITLDGVRLAESAATVMVFETGLPTRYYFERTAVDFSHLVLSDTTTACPYKGRTSQTWSVRTSKGEYDDIAWAYDFPTRQLQPITGLVAFLNEKVDVAVDGVELARPDTRFS